MRNIPIQLKQAIMSGKICNLVKIVRPDSVAYYFSDHDTNIVHQGNTYKPAPGLQRLRMESTIDSKVSNQIFNAGWLDFDHEDLSKGLFDNAEITVMKLAWEDPSLGHIITFYGNLGIIQWTEDGFKADVHSITRKLNRNYGLLTTATCRHRLFDTNSVGKCGACLVDRASYTFTGLVDQILSDRFSFNTTGTFPSINNYCSYGELTFTSGLNSGLTYEISKHEVSAFSSFQLTLHTKYEIQVGDTFTVTAGCDKSFTTCKDKFNNLINFGGMPHINQEVMYR